jgi:MoaA/NifB/PqqE/SkfB family radical SAM enzyme
LLSINLTENCQSKCVTCSYGRTIKRDRISTQRAVRLMAESGDLGFRYVRFLGGEPLLRSDLFEILEHIPPRAFAKVILATNGLLLGRVAERVNRSPITHITVSIDGIGTTNDQLRGVPGYFDTVMANLQRIKGKRVKIASIATRFLADEIGELLRLCEDRGYDFDVCLPSVLLPFADTAAIAAALEALWPSEGETDRILGTLRAHGLISRSIAAGARAYLVRRRFPFSRCILGFTDVHIRANGDVHPGCYQLGPTGNVLESSLGDILQSASASALARRMYRLDCSGCLIGWQTSRVFQRPLGNLAYVRRRLGKVAGEPANGSEARVSLPERA